MSEELVDVMIGVNYGDLNYDFSCHNIINYYANRYVLPKLDKKSGLYWLTKQQRKLVNLSKYLIDKLQEADRFAISVSEELSEMCCPMGQLVFLVKMSVPIFTEITKAKEQLSNCPDYDYLYPKRYEKTGGMIYLSKDSVCGLFDKYAGGGSLLGIELNKDVQLPMKFVSTVIIDDGSNIYLPNCVYGGIDYSDSFIKFSK